MNDVTSAWKAAGDRLTALGAALKEHYEERRGPNGSERSEQEMASATQKLTSAVQEAFDAMGAAAKDPEVREDVRRVGRSLAGALSATFAEVSDDLRKVADKAQAGPEPEPPAQQPEQGATAEQSDGEKPWGSQNGEQPPGEPSATAQ